MAINANAKTPKVQDEPGRNLIDGVSSTPPPARIHVSQVFLRQTVVRSGRLSLDQSWFLEVG